VVQTLALHAGCAHCGMKIGYHAPRTGWHQGRGFLSAESLDISLTWMLHGTPLCGTRPSPVSTHISFDN
jgi:hypothetical protein